MDRGTGSEQTGRRVLGFEETDELVAQGPPVAVQVEAAIAIWPQTPELLAELNALNAAGRWVRFYCYPGDEVVYVSYALLADAVTP